MCCLIEICAVYKSELQIRGGIFWRIIQRQFFLLARLFSKKMSRYYHSPGVGGGGVVRKL